MTALIAVVINHGLRMRASSWAELLNDASCQLPGVGDTGEASAQTLRF
ncbi:hypothetical protein SAMN05444580_10244 [Rhodococcus tukisamuensis]|uniref:Uncharacterized protein n=1 Tax=Rhodococcus tukisamuensis TaxID=168276 RepID=A0A1G6QGC2_9NOCA|nr:hypothetical protein SAMN05444580_10244 [Rhodococcus tukisamuensis]